LLNKQSITAIVTLLTAKAMALHLLTRENLLSIADVLYTSAHLSQRLLLSLFFFCSSLTQWRKWL